MNHIDKLIPDILFGQPKVCTYCGLEANSIDHVVPISFYGIKRKDLTNDHGIRTFSCKSCNSSLGCRVFLSFKDRLAHIASTHKRKATERKSPWSESELCELDHTLQSYVRAKKNVSDTNNNKTKWIGSPRFKRVISNLSLLEELNPQSTCYNEWLANYFKGFP